MLATPMRVRGLRVEDQVVEVATDADGRVDISAGNPPTNATRTAWSAPASPAWAYGRHDRGRHH
jgi:hypothetical protein